jgi:arylsulfatase A-like enzyme
MIDKIRETDGPLFVHIHLLKTHGPWFVNTIKKFSAGKEQKNEWDMENMDFYDDAILTVDYYFGEILKALVETGKFDDTLMVFSTDHGRQWAIDKPLPLIVHLPGQRAGEVVDTPVQLLDIAPSLLSYLGLEKPDWMEGAPVFSAADREALGAPPIYAFKPTTAIDKNGVVLKKSVGPPFYGFEEASIVKNGFIYRFWLESGESTLYNLSGPMFINRAYFEGLKLEYREELFGYMESRGIDTSSLLKGG